MRDANILKIATNHYVRIVGWKNGTNKLKMEHLRIRYPRKSDTIPLKSNS